MHTVSRHKNKCNGRNKYCYHNPLYYFDQPTAYIYTSHIHVLVLVLVHFQKLSWTTNGVYINDFHGIDGNGTNSSIFASVSAMIAYSSSSLVSINLFTLPVFLRSRKALKTASSIK